MLAVVMMLIVQFLIKQMCLLMKNYVKSKCCLRGESGKKKRLHKAATTPIPRKCFAKISKVGKFQ